MDPITIGLALSKLAPAAMRLFGKAKAADKAEEVSQALSGLAQSVTGKSSPEDALAALQTDPQLALKYEQAVMDNEAAIDRLYLEDRQSARDRDVKLHQAGYTNRRADVMVVVAFLSLCFVIWSIWSSPDIPAGVLAIFNMAVGALLKMLGDAFAFEFGSSRGSKEKDRLTRL